MSERKTSSPWLTAAIVACVLLTPIGGYVGAYYALVEAYPTNGFMGWSVQADYSSSMPTLIDPYDGDLADRLETVFGPIHWLDRRIRPTAWDFSILYEAGPDGPLRRK